MHKKIMTLLIVLIFSISCLAVVAEDNNTTDNLTNEESENLIDYIIPISISDNGIEFSDGFTGFCLDLSKSAINVDDKFTSTSTNDEEIENNVKLAIIECYLMDNENNIGDFVSQAIKGNKKYDVVDTFLDSSITDDTIAVNINNTTEATFTFELLKSANSDKSDCLAYKVSMKKIADENVLSSSDDEKLNLSALENETVIDETGNATDEKTEYASGGELVNESDDKQSDGETTVNETNKTIVNKTNVVIVNETNTTIINKNTTKVINKTKEAPQNATVQDQIMRTVGNPIFLLVIVIVIIAIVAVVMRRKN